MPGKCGDAIYLKLRSAELARFQPPESKPQRGVTREGKDVRDGRTGRDIKSPPRCRRELNPAGSILSVRLCVRVSVVGRKNRARFTVGASVYTQYRTAKGDEQIHLPTAECASVSIYVRAFLQWRFRSGLAPRISFFFLVLFDCLHPSRALRSSL